jgi:hypothetical protein
VTFNKNTMRRGLPWFRLYAEIVDDPKLRLLAFEDRWHFVALLALKCSGMLDGSTDLGLLHRMVAVKLGVEVRELETVAKRLAEVSLIDAETLQPLAWERRQAASDSSRDRTREWRERQREGGNRHSDGEVTVQREKEKERKNKKEQSQELVHSHGSRLPTDWTLPPDWMEWARGVRPDLNIDNEAAKFADYWHAMAGKDGCKADWLATWRNWIRRAHHLGGAMNAPRQSAVDRVMANIQRAQEDDERFGVIEGEGRPVAALEVANG